MKSSWLFAAVLALAGASPFAQPTAEEMLTVPGGVTAFRRVAGLGDAGHAPGAVVADYARVFYKSASDQTAGTRKIADYFEFLEKLTAATSGWSNGVSFESAAANKALNEQFKDFAGLAGIHLRNVQNKRVAELETGDDEQKRQAWLTAIDVDVKQLVSRLNAGQTIQCPIPVDQVPLPAATLFKAEVFRDDRFPLLRLVADRSGSLFYMGMLSLDTETRGFVEKNFNLARDIMNSRAAAFAVFGRSIHVRDGALVLPGGADAVPVWEAVIGERISKPADFLKSAMDKDDGHAAYFLDVVTHLDTAHQQFVLGGSLKGKARIEFVRDVYDAFKEPMGAWKVQDRPFLFPGFGSPLAVAAIDLNERGTAGPDWFPEALTLVDDSHDFPAKSKARKVAALPADARWFFRWLAAEPTTSRRRFALLRFAQRRLMREAAFTPDIESMLRTASEMPALALSLERMGVQAPTTYALMGGSAWTLTQSGGRESVEAPMRRWQSAIALLEQATRRQPLPPKATESLLQSLAAIAVIPPDRAQGRIADWLFSAALPAIAPDLASRPGPTLEARALHALVVGAAPAPQFNWEGLAYRLATNAVAAKDAWAIREAAPGPTLDDLAALRDVRAAIIVPAKPEMQAKLADQLTAVSATLSQMKNEAGDPPGLAKDLRNWANLVRKVKPGSSSLKELARKLAEANDELSAIVLPRMVYALAVSPTSQPPAIFATIADRHDVTPPVTTGDWHDRVWRHNRSGQTGVGSSLQGALLGIDVELADSQPRDAGPAVVSNTQLNGADHDSWLALIALSRADPVADEQARSLVADAMKRGRAQLAKLVAAGPAGAATLESTLVSAGTSETRAGLAAFEVRRGRPASVAPMLRPMDFYQLGTTAPWPAVWGGAAANMDGCLCLVPAMRRAPESWLGYPGTGVLTASTTDASARLAEMLTEMKLPGWLAAPLAPFVVGDLLHHTQQFGPDDWEALLYSRQIDAAKVEEWLLALVAAGLLAPPAGGGTP